MKIVSTLVLTVLLATVSAAQAGITVGVMRLIYDGGKKESSLKVSNPDNKPNLIQSWVTTASGGTEKVPFIITPPLFRLDSGQENVLRVIRADDNLPADRESLYWINIKGIQSSDKDATHNKLQIALTTRIKLIYRPKGVKCTPEEVTDKLTWQRNGNHLQVTNPTPFYMNFYELTVAGKEVNDVTYVAPGSTASFTLPMGVSSGTVGWRLISDYSAIGSAHSASL